MRTALILLATVLVLAACAQRTEQPLVLPSADEQVGSPAPADTGAASGAAGSGNAGGEAPDSVSLSVDVHEWAWTPSTLRVKEGQVVSVTITNTGQNTHGFAVPEFNVNEAIPPGESRTVTFTADKQGTFRFFCSVPCGSGHTSMKGEIVVE